MEKFEKFTNKEMRDLLHAIEQMIFFPIHNKWNLSDDELKDMKQEVQLEISNR
jgi:hypothetical protein